MLAALLIAVATHSPNDELSAAARDLASLPPEVRPGVRYLTLYNLPESRRRETAQTVGYVLNALSRSRAISKPAPITPTLLRFSIAQYAPANEEFAAWHAAWEGLVRRDPYFHLQTEVAAEAGGGRLAADGRQKAVGGRQMAEGRVGSGQLAVVSRKSPLSSGNSSLTTNHRPLTTSLLTTDGGWLDLHVAAQLRNETKSSGAILRADFFLAHATVPPAYHEFAGIAKTENEFLKSLGVDVAVIDKLRANAGANLLQSGVTDKPRRVIWSQGPLGGVYATLDVQQVDAARDPLRRPVSADGFNFQYDASEWFAMAPNGLWRTALFDAAGKRQDAVPDKVAKDTSDPLGDGIVVPMLSCIRCHREGGLRPFEDDQSRLLRGTVQLFSPDAKVVQRAAEFYDEPRLQRQMKFDRETYTAACGLATKVTADDDALSPDQLCDALALAVRQFAYEKISLADAAAEVGVSPDHFRQQITATRDPVLLLLLTGRRVLRGQWESSFAEAAISVR